MYSKKSGLILGFHGCDLSVRDAVINNSANLKFSENNYDWLGNGIYFWENSPSRALEFAKHLMKHPNRAKNPIKKPAVLGAVISPGYCLDLTVSEDLELLKSAYPILRDSYTATGYDLPQNKAVGNSEDLLLRYLDCAVIETLHQWRAITESPPFDSVRGVFWEGGALYPNAGFREKDHVQVCVRNPNCIKGYFIPRKHNNYYSEV